MPDRRSNRRNPIQLSRIIFQIVDGNMIISVALRGLEKPPQGDGTERFTRSFEKRWPVLHRSDSNETRTRNVNETRQEERLVGSRNEWADEETCLDDRASLGVAGVCATERLSTNRTDKRVDE